MLCTGGLILGIVWAIVLAVFGISQIDGAFFGVSFLRNADDFVFVLIGGCG